MQLRTSNIIMIVGGAIALVSLILVWAKNPFGNLTLWGLRDYLDTLEPDAMNFLAGVSVFFILVFGVANVFEGFYYATKPELEKKYKAWMMIVNGVFPLAACILIMVEIGNLSAYDLGLGCSVGVVGSAVCIVSGFVRAKEFSSFN